MESASEKSAYMYQENQVAYRQPFINIEGEEDFEEHLEQIWNKVMLLTEVAIIENESDKFTYAYRFAELALEKVCKENAALRARVRELSVGHPV